MMYPSTARADSLERSEPIHLPTRLYPTSISILDTNFCLDQQPEARPVPSVLVPPHQEATVMGSEDDG